MKNRIISLIMLACITTLIMQAENIETDSTLSINNSDTSLYKLDLKYNNSGKLLSSSSYHRNKADTSWTGSYHAENSYNSNDDLIQAITFSWNLAKLHGYTVTEQITRTTRTDIKQWWQAIIGTVTRPGLEHIRPKPPMTAWVARR